MLKQNSYFRKEAMSLQKQIEEARFFLSHHKPSLGFWGEHLLRGFLRANLPGNIRVSQGFVLLDEKTESTIQNLYYLIHKKEEGVEHIFSDSISPQCDIIIYTGEPVKTFGEIEVVNSKDVISVIEVKCSIDRNQFETTIGKFKRLNRMGIINKYLFVYDFCEMQTISSYFYKKTKADDVEKNYVILDEVEYAYDKGDECYLPTAIVGVDRNCFLCQDYIISDRDQYGYAAYEFRDDTEKLSCLQLFLSHLLGDSFEMNFESIINKYSFVLYDL